VYIMDLSIRVLTQEDYSNILVGWWNDWKWTAPDKDFLPSDGEGGMIVYDGDIPVCAGFIYLTNSKVFWLDWVISNKQYVHKQNRNDALLYLIDTLSSVAINNGAKYIYALIKNPSLIRKYEQLGFVKGDSYTSEMIKTIN
jgi:hypothetical protein